MRTAIHCLSIARVLLILIVLTASPLFAALVPGKPYIKLQDAVPVLLADENGSTSKIQLAPSFTPMVALFTCPEVEELSKHICLIWIDKDQSIKLAYSQQLTDEKLNSPMVFNLIKPDSNETFSNLWGVSAVTDNGRIILSYIPQQNSIIRPTWKEVKNRQFDVASIKSRLIKPTSGQLLLAEISLVTENNELRWKSSPPSEVILNLPGEIIGGTPSLTIGGQGVLEAFYLSFPDDNDSLHGRIVSIDDKSPIGTGHPVSSTLKSAEFNNTIYIQLLGCKNTDVIYGAFSNLDIMKINTLCQNSPSKFFANFPAPEMKSDGFYSLSYMDLSSADLVMLASTQMDAMANATYSVYPDIYTGQESWSVPQTQPHGSTFISAGQAEIAQSELKRINLLPGVDNDGLFLTVSPLAYIIPLP